VGGASRVARAVNVHGGSRLPARKLRGKSKQDFRDLGLLPSCVS